MPANEHNPKTKMVTISVGGNLFEAAAYVNKFGFSDFFVHAQSSGNYSIVMLKMPVDWPCDTHGPLAAIPETFHDE